MEYACEFTGFIDEAIKHFYGNAESPLVFEPVTQSSQKLLGETVANDPGNPQKLTLSSQASQLQGKKTPTHEPIVPQKLPSVISSVNSPINEPIIPQKLPPAILPLDERQSGLL
jgi:hypothetical protein